MSPQTLKAAGLLAPLLAVALLTLLPGGWLAAQPPPPAPAPGPEETAPNGSRHRPDPRRRGGGPVGIRRLHL